MTPVLKFLLGHLTFRLSKSSGHSLLPKGCQVQCLVHPPRTRSSTSQTQKPASLPHVTCLRVFGGFSGEPPSAPQAQASSSALAALPRRTLGGRGATFVSSNLDLRVFMRYQYAGIRTKNIPICHYFHKKLTSESKSISISI